MDHIYDLVHDKKEKEALAELKKISKGKFEDTDFKSNDVESGLLSALVQNEMDNAVEYLINRKDVNAEYVDSGFIWACRRVEKDIIFTILESGKVTLNALKKGIKELKIEDSQEIVDEILEHINEELDEELDEGDEDDFDFGKKSVKKKSKKSNKSKKPLKKSKKSKKIKKSKKSKKSRKSKSKKSKKTLKKKSKKSSKSSIKKVRK